MFSGVSPEGAPGTFLARGSWREGMLEEMVIVIDRNLTEVAHMGTTAVRLVVAASDLMRLVPHWGHFLMQAAVIFSSIDVRYRTSYFSASTSQVRLVCSFQRP